MAEGRDPQAEVTGTRLRRVSNAKGRAWGSSRTQSTSRIMLPSVPLGAHVLPGVQLPGPRQGLKVSVRARPGCTDLPPPQAQPQAWPRELAPGSWVSAGCSQDSLNPGRKQASWGLEQGGLWGMFSPLSVFIHTGKPSPKRGACQSHPEGAQPGPLGRSPPQEEG